MKKKELKCNKLYAGWEIKVNIKIQIRNSIQDPENKNRVHSRYHPKKMVLPLINIENDLHMQRLIKLLNFVEIFCEKFMPPEDQGLSFLLQFWLLLCL